MLENLKERRSIRKYKPEQVEDAHLDAILEAGLYAASGMNTQNTIMVAVRDKATRDQLSRMNAEVMGSTADPFYGAPCVVVVLVEPERWIHRARQMFESEEGKALLCKWGLREDLIGVGNCILGYADEEPAPKPRREGRILKV